MSNKNEVYYIEDIHPDDSYYEKRHWLIGKPISKDAEICIWEVGYPKYGWVYIYNAGLSDEEGDIDTFYAVKLTTATPPVKPFWQKLFTWSW